MQILGKAAVITGASSGIGRALAVELGLRGAKVIIAARRMDKLAETSAILNGYGIDNLALPLDLTSNPSIQNFLQRLEEVCPRVDIFVNNAAVGLFEDTAKASPEDIGTVFQTNLWGPLELVRHIVPRLQGGTLVNLSSAAAKYAPFQQGIYAASKAALERITEAIGLEEESHMRTLLVVPDRTATLFMQHVVGSRENARMGLNLRFASPTRVAAKIAVALERDKSLCYTTAKARVYAVLSAVAPDLVKIIIRKMS